MKYIFIFNVSIVLLAASCKNSTYSPQHSVPTQPQLDSALNIVILQDVTASSKSVVEFITSQTLSAYYIATTRNITLHIGLIGGCPTRFVTGFFPGITLHRPLLPDLVPLSITEKRKAKEQYVKDVAKYVTDSTAFYTNRQQLIQEFSGKVDALLKPYTKQLLHITDISSALVVTEKIFNYVPSKDTKCFLICNSDGIDTKSHSMPTFIKKHIPVILVNATGNRHSSMDSIVTTTLEDVQQAIQYTLN